VLINTSEGQIGVGRGFWKDLGVKIDLADTHHGAFYCLMRGECYNYFADFCAHNEELQQYVWDRVMAGLGIETEEGEFINQVLREQVEYYARASTSNDQISISDQNPMKLRFVNREFFLNMRAWLDQACHYTETGRLVWDVEFLTKAAKHLRREFTITVPLNQPWDLYHLTLAKELKEDEAYCPYMDDVEMLTVCNIEEHPRSIDHLPVKEGKLVKSVIGDTRQLAGCGRVGEDNIAATAHPEKCIFQAMSSGNYNYVTVRVSFRLS
jgi:hypothetical protein